MNPYVGTKAYVEHNTAKNTTIFENIFLILIIYIELETNRLLDLEYLVTLDDVWSRAS